MNKYLYNMELVSDGSIRNDFFDLFLLAAGSDSRAYELLRKMKSNEVIIKNVLLFHFQERITGINEDDSYYDYKAIEIDNLSPISCSIKDPSSCLENLVSLEPELLSAKKVAIDISCFTKPYFFYLIKLFSEKYNLGSISVFYTEPLSYVFPTGIFNSYHSSSGPLTILEIPGYPGYEEQGVKRVLIILLGFDGDYSKEINQDISPSETMVVNGFPGYAPKYKDISLIANEKLTSDNDVEIKFSRANNPFEVYNLLENIKNKNENSFINVAPLGTKPMALGACLFALNYPEVRVVYPLPERYEKVTTNNCWNSWRYLIPLKLI